MERKLIKCLSLRRMPNTGYLSSNILADIYFSYAHHLGNWKRMTTNAPAWVKYWKDTLMEKLLYKFFL